MCDFSTPGKILLNEGSRVPFANRATRNSQCLLPRISECQGQAAV
jgi:hypothetical protein